ncbi:MAG: type II toxin-antitoxin system Phd/YefM family antitoxin [Treponema sp.]|jgi:prevent-host-death family protein|nr:type II toxin-antitoxin system Phd/YefM family antitoxin [Treponema sp.]
MPIVPKIRPVSDLRNKFRDISGEVHESNAPVYLTKNGRGDMVVMSLETYEQNLFESEIYLKLKEAEYQATSVKKRFTHDEVMSELRKVVSGKETRRNNPPSRDAAKVPLRKGLNV